MHVSHRNRYGNGFLSNVFSVFVFMSLSLLVGLQGYEYFWGPSQATLNSDFSDIRYIVVQLTHGLTEVSRKHERLQGEMERISSALPAVAEAATRAKDALEPSMRRTGQALDVQDYDRQMVDYALESAGARILDTGETIEHMVYESPVSWVLHTITALMCSECLGARAIIRPESLPGECWAFKGARGEATIRLLGFVRVTGVSIEHIPPQIAPTREISSAPRLFQLEGLEFRKDPFPHDFGTFEYNKDGKSIQYFEVLQPATKAHSIVRLRVRSNWGHPVYTCVYRVRIHGELDHRPSSHEDDLRIENE